MLKSLQALHALERKSEEAKKPFPHSQLFTGELLIDLIRRLGPSSFKIMIMKSI